MRTLPKLGCQSADTREHVNSVRANAEAVELLRLFRDAGVSVRDNVYAVAGLRRSACEKGKQTGC